MRKPIIVLMAMFYLLSNAIGQELKSSYAIQNVKTVQNLRPYEAMSNNGNKIVMYEHKAWQCMTWDFIQIKGNIYTLKNQYTSKTIQSSETPAKIGSKLIQEPLKSSDNQQWEFIPFSNNNYLIRLKGTDLYITATEKTDNTPVLLQPKKPADLLQVWRLIEQHPNS